MTVYLVGAGPGDPGLITVRGADLLRSADAVVYDRLANSQLLDHVPSGAIRVSAGKGPGSVDLTQDEINAKLVELGQSHQCVVRLKGGDPFVFGRGGEEAQYLIDHGIDFEVVPGITSAISAAAYAGIPVTQRGVATNFTVVTGHEDPTKDSEQVKWADLAKIEGTIVVLMGVGNRGAIAEALIAGGKKPNTSVAIVRNGTLPVQESVRTTLAELGAVEAKSPSVMVIGDVAAMDLSWFENKKLFGTRVVVTRAREQQSQITSLLVDLGAEVIEAPTIEIDSIDFVIPDLTDVSYVIFTSANGVHITMKRLMEESIDARYFAHSSIAAMGSATADALKTYGLIADIVPGRFIAEDLVELFPVSSGVEKVVCFKATDVRDVIEKELTAKRYSVENVDVYKTRIAEVSQATIEEVRHADVITFASSSTVTNALQLFGHDVISSIPVKVSIGPITSATMKENNLEVTREADPHTIEGIVDAVVKVTNGT
ncbi:MAG TPA: uroporphyrinogen-III C-methyltransferase [Acidimicrobiia bacterium]|nr:uroporphyrinogen-III C-methyltransferase [Acidimicrobiia bacterium]